MHNYVLRVSSVGKFGSAEAIFCPLEFRKKLASVYFGKNTAAIPKHAKAI